MHFVAVEAIWPFSDSFFTKNKKLTNIFVTNKLILVGGDMRLTPRQRKFMNAPSDKIAEMLSDVSKEDPVIKIWDDQKDKDEKWVVQLGATDMISFK